jgi:hypothetical protein
MTPRGELRDTLVEWVKMGAIAVPASKRDELVNFLQGLDVDEPNAIDFMPLPDGRWKVGRSICRRVPKGVRHAHAALVAHAAGEPPPTVPGRSLNAVRTAIRTYAVKWAEARCRELIPVLEAIHVRDSETVFEPPISGLPALRLKN